MQRLSFEFKYNWVKIIAILISILTNLFLIIYIFLYIIVWNYNISFAPIIFIILYILASLTYDYFLCKSVNIRYNDQSLIILNKQKIEFEIDYDFIQKIRRTFYFFYRIDYKTKSNSVGKLYFFISPNPTLTEPDKIKKLKKQILKMNLL